jgi:uncharacterized protein
MVESLQDQMLKLGLVTEDQLRDAREKPKHVRKGPNNKGSKGKGPHNKGPGAKRKGKPRPDPARAQEQRAKPKPKPAPARNGDTLDPEERALRKRVHTMIADATIAREEAEVPYHFVKGSRVKRLYVTQEQRDQLAAAQLAVAAMKGRHYLIPMAVAKEVKALIPPYFIAMGNSQDPVDADTEVDDEYADYQVPDDLMW